MTTETQTKKKEKEFVEIKQAEGVLVHLWPWSSGKGAFLIVEMGGEEVKFAVYRPWGQQDFDDRDPWDNLTQYSTIRVRYKEVKWGENPMLQVVGQPEIITAEAEVPSDSEIKSGNVSPVEVVDKDKYVIEHQPKVMSKTRMFGIAEHMKSESRRLHN